MQGFGEGRRGELAKIHRRCIVGEMKGR